MAKKSSSTISQKRKPRLLWANPFCLLDTSSGASMTVRQMLHQLVQHGYEVQVLGCTIFDNPKGMGRLKEQYPDFKTSLHQLIEVEDGALSHQVVVTARTTRNHLTTHEEGLWYSQYLYMLDSFKPDIVWFYGGQTLDLLIPDEARTRGIPSAFYLANGSYKAVRWCRDIDLILTDSQSTADMYRTSKNAGFAATPVGKFIDPANFVAETHERKRLLFVNPSWQKGASVVVQLALALEQKRPDIQLEVVEARADWSAVLRETTKKLGEERATLSNVIVTPNTSDMRGPYSRARLLLAPSLWWESSGRVLAEAMLNGVPALITNRGGMPEMIGDAGIAFDFPEECYEAPHQHLLNEEQLQPLYDAILDFYDDTALYEKYVQRAWTVGKQRHHIDQATERLTRALAPFVKLRAGNKDFTAAQQKRHRQGLASIASKPKFKVDASLQLQNQKPGRSEKSMPLVRGDFDWQIEGKIIVLDSRAKLLKMGAAENLTKTGAFGIIAFDPASEVSDPKQYEGSETTQVFQHALLGDGNPATLHTCLDASMSSTLEPLPQEELPGQYQQGSQVLTKLPINTIALDSIEGLPGLDWLILDELSDTATILEHGQQALKETLIIQARVAFQPTHKHQPSLTELQHWASRNGFRFYRFNNMSHRSLFPEGISDLMASELESADVLFLPTAARLENMSAAQHRKLAFLLDVVFRAHDAAYRVLKDQSEATAEEYRQNLINSTQHVARSDLDETVRKLLPKEKKLGTIRWFLENGSLFGNNHTPSNVYENALTLSGWLRPFLELSEVNAPITLAETGLSEDRELITWRKLFPKSRIISLDKDDRESRQHTSCSESLDTSIQDYPEPHELSSSSEHIDHLDDIPQGEKANILICDNTHDKSDAINTFKNARPYLAKDFVAFIKSTDSVEKEICSLLPGHRVMTCNMITIIGPDIDAFPRRIPSIHQMLHEMQVMHERLGYKPIIEQPRTFNEKVVHRKLFGAPANAALLADKILVRDYIRERVGAEFLTKIYQTVDDPKKIDWKILPKRFVMKSNHANAQVKIVHNKNKLDKKEAEALCQTWLNSVYGEQSNEYWYADIKPLIYFEEFLGSSSGKPAEDYKLFVYHGECKVIQVDHNRLDGLKRSLMTPKWEELPVTIKYPQGALPQKPEGLEKMIKVAEKLSNRLSPFFRIDLYNIDGKIYFGEVTLSPGAGWSKITDINKKDDPLKADLYLGQWW